jgi:methylmalonyl-CoA/ethylmalonyl-CoA epimerase
MSDETNPPVSPLVSPLFKDVVQIGVVVRDMEKVMQALTTIFGIGPFRTILYPPEDRPDIQREYYGEPGDFCYRQAFAELGNIELELIQPLSGHSIWADFLEKHGEGIHHIRFNTYDLEPVIKHLADHGIPVAMSGSGLRPGTSWANFASEDQIGFTIEMMKALPGTSGRTPQILAGQIVS